MDLVEKERYFTIWAPRQTGKSTYFLLLKSALNQQGYLVMTANFENFKDASMSGLLRDIRSKLESIGISSPEFATFGDVSEFLELLKGKKVVLGLVTTKFGELEDKDTIKRRIDAAAKYVALEDLCLSPQCGFSSTHHGNNLSQEDQWRKLERIVEVAREVWK